MTRRNLGLLLVALVTVAACSSGHKPVSSVPTTTPATSSTAGWDPTAVATVRALVVKIRHAFPGQCGDAGLLPRDAYLGTMRRLHLTIPLAVVDCTGFGESIELSVFPNPEVRATYVTGRATAICRSAVRGKYDLPGLHWVVAPNFAVEPESEGVSREIAPIINGTYQVTPCPGHTNIDWDPAGERTVAELAGKLAASPKIACKGFHLLSRDQYVKIQAYAGRLPAAYGQCTAVGAKLVWIAAFSATTVTPQSFISSESKYQCGSVRGVAAVRGPSWAIVVAQVKLAALAAAATGGTALPAAC